MTVIIQRSNHSQYSKSGSCGRLLGHQIHGWIERNGGGRRVMKRKNPSEILHLLFLPYLSPQAEDSPSKISYRHFSPSPSLSHSLLFPFPPLPIPRSRRHNANSQHRLERHHNHPRVRHTTPTSMRSDQSYMAPRALRRYGVGVGDCCLSQRPAQHLPPQCLRALPRAISDSRRVHESSSSASRWVAASRWV
ncbi:hypothetical protein BC567DRAFT_219669 [Phyllosticta citribraziliensis]